MERRVESLWMLKWGSSSMSWRTWLILTLVTDVTHRPVSSLCLSDSSPNSHWATHLWTVWSEGTHSITPMTYLWCICIAANPSFHLCKIRNLTCWLCENDAIFSTVLIPLPKHIQYYHTVYILEYWFVRWHLEIIYLMICILDFDVYSYM